MIAVLSWFLSVVSAQTIVSDCTPAEVKTLQSSAMLEQVVAGGARVQTLDCTPIKPQPDKEYLLALYTLNTKGGYESYLTLFERMGFGDKSVVQFKSTLIGFDLFPVWVNKVHRLMFVHPSSDRTKLVLYLNPQIAPAATKFARWEYSYDKKELIEILNRYWLVEAGILPKIYDDRGTFRALIESRSVEL